MADSAKLIVALKQLLAHSYVMYFRAHSAHWNVVGGQFITLHGFFGDIYSDIFGSIDRVAEAIRQHNEYAPVDLSALLKSGSSQEKVTAGGSGPALLAELRELNTKLMKHLAYTRTAAEEAGDFGLANFIQDREAVHLKWDWQLKALLT